MPMNLTHSSRSDGDNGSRKHRCDREHGRIDDFNTGSPLNGVGVGKLAEMESITIFSNFVPNGIRNILEGYVFGGRSSREDEQISWTLNELLLVSDQNREP